MTNNKDKIFNTFKDVNKDNGSSFTSLNNKKNIIERKCVACHHKFDRDNLIKITKEHESSEIVIEPNNRQFGRSAYLCYNMDCLRISIKKKRLQKSLRTKISDDVLEKLKNIITEKIKH